MDENSDLRIRLCCESFSSREARPLTFQPIERTCPTSMQHEVPFHIINVAERNQFEKLQKNEKEKWSLLRTIEKEEMLQYVAVLKSFTEYSPDSLEMEIRVYFQRAGE